MAEIVPNPFSSHYWYLVRIALPNYSNEFNSALKKRDEGHKNGRSEQELIRHFVNAAEALNNSLEYFYWENYEEGKHVADRKFCELAREKYPVLATLADIANAYKHARRNGKSANNLSLAKASQLVNPGWFEAYANEYGLQGKLHNPSVKEEWIQSLTDAYQFWIQFVNESPEAKQITESFLEMMLKEQPSKPSGKV